MESVKIFWLPFLIIVAIDLMIILAMELHLLIIVAMELHLLIPNKFQLPVDGGQFPRSLSTQPHNITLSKPTARKFWIVNMKFCKVQTRVLMEVNWN